jgi:hypothetical protein
MSESIVEHEEIDCSLEISDEALEIAGGEGQENPCYTLGACSGLSVCPG